MSKSKAKKTAKVTQKTKVIFDSSSRKAKKLDKQESHVHRLFVKLKFKKPNLKTPNLKPWLEDKIKAARKLSEHRAARAAARFGGPAGVALAILFTLVSLLWPKNEFQKAKEQLAKNPNDLEAHLVLAEKFLENNQFEEAGQILRLAQAIKPSSYQAIELPASPAGGSSDQILGQEADVRLDELWKRKTYSDPKEIKRLITAWEKILQEKPDYRDGYLQLATLHYKIYEDERVKEYLNKAVELDPNFEPARKWERVIGN